MAKEIRSTDNKTLNAAWDHRDVTKYKVYFVTQNPKTLRGLRIL